MVHGGRAVTTVILVVLVFVSAVQCMEKPEKIKAPRNITRTLTRNSMKNSTRNSTKITRSTSEPSDPGPTAAATRVPPITYSAAPAQQTAVVAPTANSFSQNFVNSPYAAQFMPGAVDLSSFFHPQFTGTTQHHGLDLDSLYAEYNAQYGGSQSFNTPLPNFSTFYNTPPPATAASIKQANRQPVYYQSQRQPTSALTNYNTIRPSQRQPSAAEYASVYTSPQRQPTSPQRPPPMAIYSSYYQSQRQPTPAEYASVYQQSSPQSAQRGQIRGSPPPPTVDYNTLIRLQQGQGPRQQQLDPNSVYYAQQQQQQQLQQQKLQQQQLQQQLQQQQHQQGHSQRVPQGRPQGSQQLSQGPVKIDVKTLISNHVLPQIKGSQGIQILDLSEFYGPQGPPGQGQSGTQPNNFFQLTQGVKQPELTLSPEQLAYYQQQAQAAGPVGSAANPTLSPEQLSAYYKESGHTDPRIYQKLQQQQQSGRPDPTQSPHGTRLDSSQYQQQSARPDPVNVHVNQQQQSSRPDLSQYQGSYQGVRPTPTVYIGQGGQQQVVYQQQGGRPETVHQGRPDLSAYQGAQDPNAYQQQGGPSQGQQHPDVAGLSPNELKSLYAQFALQTQGAQSSQHESVPANHHPSYQQGVDLAAHYKQQHVPGPATTGVVYVGPGAVSLGPLDPRTAGPTATPSAAEEPPVRQPSSTLAALASYFQHQQQQQGSAGPSGYNQRGQGPLVNGYQQTSPNYYASTAIAAPNPIRGSSGSSGRPQQLTHISSPLPTAAAPSPAEAASKTEKTRQLVKKPHSFGQGYSFEISG